MKQLCHFMLTACIGVLIVFVPLSCQKNTDEIRIPDGQQRISIRLSDNPVNYDAVNVDIQQVIVQVIPDSCRGRDNNNNDCYDDNEYRCSVWDTLNIRAGVYNLLSLSNGVDTLLASGLTLTGRVNKIKLVLGDNNSVVVDSVSYPLTLWNNQHTVTLQVKGADIHELTPAELQLWLDFDAGGSIVKVSHNRFVLKPRIKIFVPDLTSGIKGKVLPKDAKAVVAAIANGDTLIAIPDHRSGWFKIRGLQATTADIFINATAGNYRDTTITGVSLERGEETDIGTIQLRQ